MAIRTNSVEQANDTATENSLPVYWTESEFKGTPIFNICQDFVLRSGQKKTNYLLAGGPKKLANILGGDEDGDSLLMNVVFFLQEHAEDFTSVLANLDKFVQAYMEFRGEYLGDNNDLLKAIGATSQEPEEAVSEKASSEGDGDPSDPDVSEEAEEAEEGSDAPVEEPVPEEAEIPAPPKASLIKFKNMLKTQTRIWRSCRTEEERNDLVNDAYFCVEQKGLAWEVYRKELETYKTAESYLVSA